MEPAVIVPVDPAGDGISNVTDGLAGIAVEE
jgi:hypothetical protein